MSLKNKNGSKIKIALLPLLFALELFSAQSGPYIELGVGLGTKDTLKTHNVDYKYEDSYLGSIAIGYQLDSLSVEIAQKYKTGSLYSTSSKNHQNISAEGNLVHNSQMINFYYSGYNSSKFVSSIGLGVGVTKVSLEDVVELEYPQKDIDGESVLSYQGMFSVGYMFTPSVTLLAKYTYFQISNSDDFKSDGDNLLSLNLRYLF